MTKERLRWTAATGSLERVQTWRGEAGPADVTYASWLSNFAGYTSLERSVSKPQLDGDGIYDVEIGFAAAADGTVIPPGSPDYGLIERVWEKHTLKEQETLLGHPMLDPLYAKGGQFDYLPSRIRHGATTYAADMKAWIKAEAQLDDGETGDPQPNAQKYHDKACRGFTLTNEELRITVWLFSEFAANPNATWQRNRPALRKMETVLAVANVSAAHADMDRIFSPATFLAREATVESASLIQWSGLAGWYWHKQSPDVQRTSNGWFRITQEYHGVAFIAPQTVMRYGDVL